MELCLRTKSRLGAIIFVLFWEWAASIDVEEEVPPSFNVQDSERCEPEEWNLKKVHKKLPDWVPFELQIRRSLDLVKKLTLQGRSFAGRTEFPWLVELRETPTENWTNAENWANGNLITGQYVLTTCEAVATFKEATLGGYSFDAKLGVPNWYLEKKIPEHYRIMFASSYPYVPRLFNTKDEIGTREVDLFLPHPKCNYFILDYSLGVVRVRDQSIWPFPPFTTYMHVDFDCDAFQRMKADFNAPHRKTGEEDYCYIGLWSRRILADEYITKTSDPIKKRQFDQIWNHKVRYAVRWVDPKVCKRSIEAFPQRMHFQDVGFFECMGLNETETVGVICNHDRGAPIVCNGVVRAIVLAGATEENCKNTNPLPFLVIDARFMYSMWTNINAFALKNTTWLNLDDRGEAPSRFPPGNTAFLLCLALSLMH